MSNHSLFMKSGFPRAAWNNGVGRYVGQLQRITLKFCKSQGSSRGMRDFLEHDLVNFSKENPGVVVYVKPRRHRNPVIKAEYHEKNKTVQESYLNPNYNFEDMKSYAMYLKKNFNGRHHWLPVTNFVREDINKWMELLRTQDDDGSELRIRKMWHTDFPSIQGPWTPFTFREPSLNLAKFPDDKLGAASELEPTATERALELYREQLKVEKLTG